MKIDKKGQITVELLLLISFALITAILLANAIIDANELNVAMASARDGAFEGISSNGLAIYPKESYDNYSKDTKKQPLLREKSIKIIKINQTIKGKDNFNRTRIQLKIYASSPDVRTKEQKEAIMLEKALQNHSRVRTLQISCLILQFQISIVLLQQM